MAISTGMRTQMPWKLNIDIDSIEDLGKVPDRVIAERLGSNVQCIGRIRRRKNIPPHITTFVHINWDNVPDLLTTDASVIAKRLGCSEYTVKDIQRKRRHGFHRSSLTPRKRIDWNNVEDLGKMYDYKLAEKLGCGVSSVLNARKRLGIPAYKFDWDSIPLGEKRDGEIAKELRVPKSRVRYARVKRNIAEFMKNKKKHILELPADILTKRGYRKKLARQFNCSTSLITKLRVCIDPTLSENGRLPPEVEKKLLEELNTDWSSVLSKKYGLTINTILRKRRERGVGRYCAERTCLCGKVFTANTSRQKHCSIECNAVHTDLRRHLGLEKNEEVNPYLFKMFLSVNKRLKSLIKPVKQEEKVVKQQRKERSNETEQTEPTNDTTRQVHDQASY